MPVCEITKKPCKEVRITEDGVRVDADIHRHVGFRTKNFLLTAQQIKDHMILEAKAMGVTNQIIHIAVAEGRQDFIKLSKKEKEDTSCAECCQKRLRSLLTLEENRAIAELGSYAKTLPIESYILLIDDIVDKAPPVEGDDQWDLGHLHETLKAIWLRERTWCQPYP